MRNILLFYRSDLKEDSMEKELCDISSIDLLDRLDLCKICQADLALFIDSDGTYKVLGEPSIIWNKEEWIEHHNLFDIIGYPRMEF